MTIGDFHLSTHLWVIICGYPVIYYVLSKQSIKFFTDKMGSTIPYNYLRNFKSRKDCAFKKFNNHGYIVFGENFFSVGHSVLCSRLKIDDVRRSTIDSKCLTLDWFDGQLRVFLSLSPKFSKITTLLQIIYLDL